MRGILILMVGMLMLFSCQTRYVTVEKVRTDTTYITKQQRDSIWLHDSLYIHEYQRGETLFVEKAVWHTAIQERIKIDTIYRAKTDTVYIEKVIEKTEKLSWWKTLKMRAGAIFLYLVIGFVLAFVVSRKIRRL